MNKLGFSAVNENDYLRLGKINQQITVANAADNLQPYELSEALKNYRTTAVQAIKSGQPLDAVIIMGQSNSLLDRTQGVLPETSDSMLDPTKPQEEAWNQELSQAARNAYDSRSTIGRLSDCTINRGKATAARNMLPFLNLGVN